MLAKGARSDEEGLLSPPLRQSDLGLAPAHNSAHCAMDPDSTSSLWFNTLARMPLAIVHIVDDRLQLRWREPIGCIGFGLDVDKWTVNAVASLG
jgi:hypothetical protein